MSWSDEAKADEDREVEEIIENDDETVAPTEAATNTEDDYGESRYARKSRSLPRIEDGEKDSKSSGSGLRNAIINGKKRSSSS